MNLICELVSLWVSFHPAAWLMKARINQTRELACDDLAVEKLSTPTLYAGALVHIAQSLLADSRNDAAEVLEITEDNVKVRLHRARALLRKSLYTRAGMERKEAFNFHAARCDRVVKNVFEQIQKQVSKTGTSTAKTQ